MKLEDIFSSTDVTKLQCLSEKDSKEDKVVIMLDVSAPCITDPLEDPNESALTFLIKLSHFKVLHNKGLHGTLIVAKMNNVFTLGCCGQG